MMNKKKGKRKRKRNENVSNSGGIKIQAFFMTKKSERDFFFLLLKLMLGEEAFNRIIAHNSLSRKIVLN